MRVPPTCSFGTWLTANSPSTQSSRLFCIETAEPREVPLQTTVLRCGRFAAGKCGRIPGSQGTGVWVRFVAVAAEVGNWQSSDTSLFLGSLARARAVRLHAASLGQVLLSEREVARVRGRKIWREREKREIWGLPPLSHPSGPHPPFGAPPRNFGGRARLRANSTWD